MINYVYQLISPHTITQKYRPLSLTDKVLIRPEYMSICHADQRYFTGERDAQVLKKKLPMALIHEAMGHVVFDPTGNFKVGQKVVMIPNIPGASINGTYPNYLLDTKFRSSGVDGFMAEIIELDADRVVACDDIDPIFASFCEFISVAFHAVDRFEKTITTAKDTIGVWGDGGLGFLVSLVLKYKFPQAKVCVIGLDESKLSRFTFADKTYTTSSIPEDFRVDHAFECCGGAGSYYAINQIIDVINPQGNIMLMGVVEKEVGINTRMVLERGLTLIGSSRSDRPDFEAAIKFLKNKRVCGHLKRIVSEVVEINSIVDIYDAFNRDLSNPYKTVLKWNI